VKVFLDANILFSAADPGSATRRLLAAVASAGQAVTCPHAWEEARRNLERKRPVHGPGLEELRRFVTVGREFAAPPETDLPDCDIPILAGALGARCDYLWTSDRRHFGRYYGEKLGGVTVVSSLQMAARIPKRA
jgi:predicted nucleic acid-binding protein